MRYKPRIIALLSMLAVLALGVSASAAFAAVQFEWKVGGAALASGATKEFTAKDKSPIHLGMLVGGAKYGFNISKLKAKSGAEIIGGRPGTSDWGSLELEGITGEGVTKGCEPEGGTIITNPLKGEIVEGANGAIGSGKVELLLAPYSGNFLAETGPQKAEAKAGVLLFEPTHKENGNHQEYKVSPGTGTTKTAGLAAGGSAATLTGEAEIELVSKEAFGAY
jgi:hypothetical protein